MTKTAKAAKKVLRALRDLEADQGRIARRNARRKLNAAVRSLHKAVDVEFPVVRGEKVVVVRSCIRGDHQHKDQNPCPVLDPINSVPCNCVDYSAPPKKKMTAIQRTVMQKRKLRKGGFVKLDDA